MRDAFERAIIENPDDVASYSAYADWLQEQGDPRGEFIAVQLALEDEEQSWEARYTLKAREAELLWARKKEWLGGLDPFFPTPPDPKDRFRYDDPPMNLFRWRRGLLNEIEANDLTMVLAQSLRTPATKFVNCLRVYQVHRFSPGGEDGSLAPLRPTPAGERYHNSLFELIGAPILQSLRVFYLGDREADPEDGWCDCHTYVPGLHHVIAEMSRVEELHLLCKGYETTDLFALQNLTNLRVLRLYHLGGFDYQRRYEYALDVLAANPAFANLTHLLFHPHLAEAGEYDGDERSYLPLDQVRALVHSPYLKKLTHLQLRLSDMGDDGIREVIASGILKQLVWLDLRHGCVTDDGARLLAACPDAKRLKRIDLSRNAVTTEGLAALRATGVNAVANDPLTQNELDSREYLREGDSE
jgi:uncharacterized protein (TIGR02996 family)